ncbi:MAG: tRNA dihydrouridine synthase DusB [Bdellovibrionales bacterium]|nr:tRNA dihydrouridine synthase DusB [Bdellovibrionales bacterium]
MSATPSPVSQPAVLALRPVKLGPFTLEHPFILAPMAGITNSPYRRLMRRMGSALMVSELISANGMEYASQRTLGMLKFHEEERLLGHQIFGDTTENLIRGAQKVEEFGANFVDLNLGCPVPKIVKKGAGAAMCRNPAQLEKVLKAMVESVKIPVTIKIRTGWDDSARNALEVIQAAHQAGITWVAVHGRTRAQGYSGEADWEFIGNLKAKSPLPIIGNGDLSTAERAVERMTTYGVDAVMIGRGALRNPFIFRQAQALWEGRTAPVTTLNDYLELLQSQRETLKGYFSPKLAALHARKFLAWYSAGFPGGSEFRRNVFTLVQEEDLWAEARGFFERSWRTRDFRHLAEPFLMGGHG